MSTTQLISLTHYVAPTHVASVVVVNRPLDAVYQCKHLYNRHFSDLPL